MTRATVAPISIGRGKVEGEILTRLGYFEHREDPLEWETMWAAIKKKYGDVACQDALTREMWEYLGSVKEGTGPWNHEFRHRNLPPDSIRIYEIVPATPGFVPPHSYTARQ